MNTHTEFWSKIHVALVNTNLICFDLPLIHMHSDKYGFISHPYQKPLSHLVYMKQIFFNPFLHDFMSHTIFPNPLAHSYVDFTTTVTTFMKLPYLMF